MLANTFVVQPDIFLAYPINRAFVEGRAKHPPLLEYRLGSIVSLLVSLALLVVGFGIIPISFGEDMAFMRWLLPLAGFVSLIGDLFLLSMTLRLRNGRLIEGRVVKTELYRRPTSANQSQLIYVEFRDVEGQLRTVLHKRPNRSNPMPDIGSQAAVLYVNPNVRRVL